MRTKRGRRVRRNQLIYLSHRHADLSQELRHTYQYGILHGILPSILPSDTAHNDHAVDANRYALEAMYEFLSKPTSDSKYRELKEKAVVWDMIDKWLEDKAGTCLVFRFKGVKLELQRPKSFEELIRKAHGEVVRL